MTRINTLLLALAAIPAFAQMQDNQKKTLTCDDHNNRNGQRLVSHCEMQEQTMAASRGPMLIDPGQNGGISIKGWSRPDMLVRAKIETSAPSDAEAKSMVSQIRVASGSGSIKAEGPAGDNDHNWSVSYEIFVPHQTDVTMQTHNGGIHIQDIKGHIQFKTTNGGVHLARLAGDVSGNTTNGGVHVELAGNSFDGTGLNVTTTNGGVHIQVPASYSAHIETSTVNGGVKVDGKSSKITSFDVGSGGPTIRVVTTNGGVTIEKS